MSTSAPCSTKVASFGYNTKCAATSPTKAWCYKGTCYTAAGLCAYMQEYIDMGSSAIDVAYYELIIDEWDEAETFYTKCTLVEYEEEEEVSFEKLEEEEVEELKDIYGTETSPWYRIFEEQNEEYIDEYGLYTAFYQNGTWFNPSDTDSANAVMGPLLQYIGTGSVGIIREHFEDPYGNAVKRYFTTASSGVGPTYDPPSVSLDDDEVATFTYSSTEKAAIKARFGCPDVGSEEGDLEAYFESLFATITEEIANTTIKPQFTFKKIKAETLDSDILSSFVETEKAQTVTTGLTVTEEVSAETDESGY